MKEENSVQSIFSAKRQLNFNCSACRVIYNQFQIVYELVYPTSRSGYTRDLFPTIWRSLVLILYIMINISAGTEFGSGGDS